MRKTFAAWETTARPDGCRLRSGDGVLTVTLRRSDAGLYVQRTVQRAREGRVVQSSVFADPASFQRWCDADASRFDYPLVHAGMLRAADEIFRADEPANVTG
jgi:ketosteroid isomerase-like protein